MPALGACFLVQGSDVGVGDDARIGGLPTLDLDVGDVRCIREMGWANLELHGRDCSTEICELGFMVPSYNGHTFLNWKKLLKLAALSLFPRVFFRSASLSIGGVSAIGDFSGPVLCVTSLREVWGRRGRSGTAVSDWAVELSGCSGTGALVRAGLCGRVSGDCSESRDLPIQADCWRGAGSGAGCAAVSGAARIGIWSIFGKTKADPSFCSG